MKRKREICSFFISPIQNIENKHRKIFFKYEMDQENNHTDRKEEEEKEEEINCLDHAGGSVQRRRRRRREKHNRTRVFFATLVFSSSLIRLYPSRADQSFSLLFFVIISILFALHRHTRPSNIERRKCFLRQILL